MPHVEPGILHVVATPIGNLEDITLRAARILGAVDRVLAEDTRHSKRLLNHLGHSPPMVSLNEHNERGRVDLVLGWLGEGLHVALISDAGTPAISDPGFPLVRAVADAGFRVVPIPGACAFVAAASAAGLPTDRLHFLGFLPGKPGKRRRALTEALALRSTTLLYASPHKLPATLNELVEIAGADRPAVVCRELTKVHEEFDRGTLGELAERWSNQRVRGELTVIIAPAPEVRREKKNKYAAQRDAEQAERNG